jgi:hypothetical protein
MREKFRLVVLSVMVVIFVFIAAAESQGEVVTVESSGTWLNTLPFKAVTTWDTGSQATCTADTCSFPAEFELTWQRDGGGWASSGKLPATVIVWNDNFGAFNIDFVQLQTTTEGNFFDNSSWKACGFRLVALPYGDQIYADPQLPPSTAQFQSWVINATNNVYPILWCGGIGVWNYSHIDQMTVTNLQISIDIKPGTCPNPLNVKSKGMLPVAVLGTENFDVTQLDPATIRLGGVAPLRWAYVDVATPFEDDKVDCEGCNELCGDGNMDLVLNFDTQEVVAALGNVEDGECATLELTAELLDGTSIAAEDVVRILNKGSEN